MPSLISWGPGRAKKLGGAVFAVVLLTIGAYALLSSGTGNGPGRTATSDGCTSGGAVAPCMDGSSSGKGASGWGVPVFGDEFNGTAMDSSKWNVEGPQHPNNSQENDCYSPKAVSVSGGYLNISIRDTPCRVGGSSWPYTAGQIDTNGHFNPTYGYFEARIYSPGANGVIDNWPAWWMYGTSWPANGEIDIFEGLSGSAGEHFAYGPSGNPIWQGGSETGQDFTGWHTYGVDWQPGSLTYYYDGKDVATITQGVTNQPMRLVLDDTTAPPGNDGGPVSVPSTMKVDYVRAWKQRAQRG